MVPTAYSTLKDFYPESVKTRLMELNSTRFFSVEEDAAAVSVWLTTTDHGQDEAVVKLQTFYESQGYLPPSSVKRALEYMTQPAEARVAETEDADVKLQAARQTSQHFGAIGEVMVGTYELLRVFKNRRRGWDAHGATYIFSSLEPETDGFQLVYRGTSTVLKRLAIGGTYILRGVISGHSDFKGILQTEFTDPKVLGGEVPEHHSEQKADAQPETRWVQVQVDKDGNPDMSSYQSEVYKTNSRKRGGRKHNRHLYRKSA